MKTWYFFQYFTMHFLQSVLYSTVVYHTENNNLMSYTHILRFLPLSQGCHFDVDLFLNPGSTMLHVVLVVVILFSWSKSFLPSFHSSHFFKWHWTVQASCFVEYSTFWNYLMISSWCPPSFLLFISCELSLDIWLKLGYAF